MDNKSFDASEFLNRLGIEDKLNQFLDSEAVRATLLPKYEAVKANVTETVARLPEKNREEAEKLIADKFETMTDEVFIEVILCKFSEDVGYALYMLNKYLDITAVTQQLLETVAEKTALLNRLEEMAIELADALRRNLKESLFGLCSQYCGSKEAAGEILQAIFYGDEDAPMLIAVEDVVEGVATLLSDYILGKSEEEEDQCNHEREHHCCCGACDSACVGEGDWSESTCCCGACNGACAGEGDWIKSTCCCGACDGNCDCGNCSENSEE